MQPTDTKAAKKKARGQIPQSTRFNVFRRDNFTCTYCGRSSPEVVLHCDHSISVKNGGEDTEANLVTACIDCNLGKSSKSVRRVIPSISTPDESGDGFSGLWGHTFADDDLLPGRKQPQWQFKVTRKLTPQLYLIQLFSWMDGEPTNCETIAADVLARYCKLYATNEQMNVAYAKECDRRNWEIKRLGGIGAAFDRQNARLALVR